MGVHILFNMIPLVTVLLAAAVSQKRRRFFKMSFSWDLACLVAGIGILTCLLWRVGNRREKTSERNLCIFVVDCSRSMLADDHGATRLQHAKDITHEMVGTLKESKLALVSFAGDCFLDLPPTDDHTAFLDALEQLKPSLEDLPGSDPAAALAFAETVAAMDPNVSATAILLSDGEIQGGTSDYWTKRKIPLVWRCVGVGAPQPIPLGQVWMRDPDTGETALTEASREPIESYAALSSAPYLHKPEDVAARIDNCHHGWLCLLAAGLFLLALRTPSPKMLILLLCVVTVQASPLENTAEEKHAHAERIRAELATLPMKSPRRAILLANWAVLISDESPDDALLLTQEALRLNPSSSAIRHNLEVLERRLKTTEKQEETTQRQSVADLDELLSLPSEKRREETSTIPSAPAMSIPSMPGTWREIKRQNRLIKPRMVKAKPW